MAGKVSAIYAVGCPALRLNFPSRPLPLLPKVHYVLDEIIMGGMVLETNINQILTAINDQNRLHAASNKVGLPPSGGISVHSRPSGGAGGGVPSGIPGMRTR